MRQWVYLAELGVERLTLSGGEPFIRSDWANIAKRLTQNGIIVNAISNGWLINIRNIPLKKIWTNPDAFSKLRKMSSKDLRGLCNTCPYAEICLGGCTGLKLTFQKHIYENAFCMFRIEIEQLRNEVNCIPNIEDLGLGSNFVHLDLGAIKRGCPCFISRSRALRGNV